VAVIALVVLGALAGPGAARAVDGTSTVQIGFAAFGPAQTTVLAGDTVTWSNVSVRKHSVNADDGTWGSADILPDGTYSHRFDTPGAVPYYCKIHTFMHGEVDVYRLLLDAPAGAANPGRTYPLKGRAALDPGSTVTIEADDGTGPRPVATTLVGEDGSFVAAVTATTSATYRAVAGADASTPVRLLVLDRRVSVSVARHGKRVIVDASVTPPSPGAPVVLQLNLRERFGWWPERYAHLDARSHVRFALRLHRSPRARVVLTLADLATPLAISRPVRVPRS
jgi:plastocyanin